MSYYKNSRGLSLSKGNLKLGTDTLIINMGSATECPSRKKGLCKLGLKCYAFKAEKVYPNCLPSRTRQGMYWLNTSARKIASDILDLHREHQRAFASIKYVRFNESGDFYSQDCVDKLDKIANIVSKCTGWIFYGYTARKDLDFTSAEFFMVKGSSNNAGNNGRTIARHRGKIEKNSTYLSAGDQHAYYEAGQIYNICPGDCRTCDICKIKSNANVVFPLH